MISLLFAILLSFSPTQTDLVDHVDVIEENHMFKDKQPQFQQCIYYDWKKTWVFIPSTQKVKWTHGFEVIDWRRLDTTGSARKNWETGKWEQRFWDQKYSCYRKVIANSCRKTKTNYDPELEARNLIDITQRKGLSTPQND